MDVAVLVFLLIIPGWYLKDTNCSFISFFWMPSRASQHYWEHGMQQGQPELGCRVAASPYSQPVMVGDSSTTAPKTVKEKKNQDRFFLLCWLGC